MRNWAKKLSYEWLESNANDDELDIPAVRGFGGILNYFVEESQLENEFYEIEFIATNNKKVDNGITQIDHIGHSISTDFFQSNTLFYRAFLGLEIEDSLEILDPRGIVYSRVAKNTNNSIRIPLSSTKSQGTSTDQFIGKTGSGIQQIAIHTNDIFKTANAIKNKALILPMPSNYYDDLYAISDRASFNPCRRARRPPSICYNRSHAHAERLFAANTFHDRRERASGMVWTYSRGREIFKFESCTIEDRRKPHGLF